MTDRFSRNNRVSTQRLSQHDINEVAKFYEYLADYATMLKVDLLAKYQGYLGLSATELEAMNRG